MSYEAWLKQYEEGMMRQGVLYTEVERAIVLEDSEIVQYYKKNPAEFTDAHRVPAQRHLPRGRGPHARGRCETLKAAIDAKLKGGAPFADTAAELSDPPMKDAKGDLGTFKDGRARQGPSKRPSRSSRPARRRPGSTPRTAGTCSSSSRRRTATCCRSTRPGAEVEEKIYGEKRAVKGEAYIKTLRERSYVKILKPDPLGLNK
ncbi:MAG: hypothetical protein MZV70_70875 [Desulfobacterales bacterium]|nr:hypothetical protein [Desulfobacterales bacterium]